MRYQQSVRHAAAMSIILAGCASLPRSAPYVVDASVRPIQDALPSVDGVRRPLAAIAESGHMTTFVENEVIFAPATAADLGQFLKRYHGAVLHEIAPLPPPPGTTVQRPLKLQRRSFLIRIDPSGFDARNMIGEAAKLGGDVRASRYSSANGAKILALAIHESVGGAIVQPNFVSRPQGLFFQLPKSDPAQGPSAGQTDALHWLVFNDPEPRGSSLHCNPEVMPTYIDANFSWMCLGTTTGSNVFKAWQYVDAYRRTRGSANLYRPKLAVLDGGFWLDAQGNVINDPNGGSTLTCEQPACPARNHPWQGNMGVWIGYSPLSNPFGIPPGAYIAQGTNPTSCTNGNPCPWHGTYTSNTALARLDYRYDGAGTGGQVADPMLFLVDLSDAQMAAAILTATLWGADIVSISSDVDCGSWVCQHFDMFSGENAYRSAIDQATAAGVLVVAAAGNTIGSNAGNADNNFPCGYTPVLCVGSLGDGLSRPRVASNANDWSSDFGGNVNIWAPSNIPELALQASGASNPLPGSFAGMQLFNGTSASTPFVAGIAAMVKAINPGLSGGAILGLLTGTAWGHDVFRDEVLDLRRASNSAGAEVFRVNAYAAVVAAAAGYPIPPEVHIVNPSDNPHQVTSADNGPLTQLIQAWGYDLDDSGADGQSALAASALSWSITPPLSVGAFGGPECATAVDGCLIPFSGPEPPAGPPTQFGPFGVAQHNFDFTSQQPGSRTVTVTATDRHGASSSQSITLNVAFATDAPKPIIVSPSAAGGDYGVGSFVLLEGHAQSTDPGSIIGWTPCTQMQWTTSATSLTPDPAPDFAQDGNCQATVSFASPGSQVLTLTAWNRLNQQASAAVGINVVNATNFDFTMSLQPTSLRAVIGASPATAAIVIGSLTGSPQPVHFAVSGVPKGVSVTLSGELSPPGSGLVTISSAAQAAAGTYDMTVFGYGPGGATHSATLTLNLDTAAQ